MALLRAVALLLISAFLQSQAVSQPKLNTQEGRAGSSIRRKVPAPPPGATVFKAVTPAMLKEGVQGKIDKIQKSVAHRKQVIQEKIQIVKDNLPDIKKKFAKLGHEILEGFRP